MKSWIKRQFATPWVVKFAIASGIFLAGMAVQGYQDSKATRTCAVCNEDGAQVGVHKSCLQELVLRVDMKALVPMEETVGIPEGDPDGSQDAGQPIYAVERRPGDGEPVRLRDRVER